MALLDQAISDVSAVSDQLLIETAFNSDPIDATDSVVVSRTLGVVASDSVATSDTIQRGFVLWANLFDNLFVPDQVVLNAQYNLTFSDTVTTTDLSHTWQTANGKLTATLEGDSDLNAVLMKRNTAAPVPQTRPPRVTNLPKPPPILTHHVTVDPSPPRRGQT